MRFYLRATVVLAFVNLCAGCSGEGGEGAVNVLDSIAAGLSSAVSHLSEAWLLHLFV